MTDIPLVDLAAQHETIAADVVAEITALMERGAFILGEPVARFEREFAANGARSHCVGVANGTDALELAFRAAGVAAGDEVLMPVNTFAATAFAAVRAGARPQFCDCDDTYHLLDVEDAASRISDATKVVVPVHLYGQMAPTSDVARLAADARVTVVEDAAQAQGASQNGETPGARAASACYSFYPSKNLGAYGDAGAVVTDDLETDSRLRALRAYGSTVKYSHPELGFNSRLDALQAAILSIKLARLNAWNTQRRTAAQRYDEMLADLDDVRLPRTAPGNVHVWHLYVIRLPRRDEVLESLRDQGIGAGIHYPHPLHLEGAFRDLGYSKGDFPVAERLAGEILSLPLYPEITSAQQERVAEALRKSLS